MESRSKGTWVALKTVSGLKKISGVFVYGTSIDTFFSDQPYGPKL